MQFPFDQSTLMPSKLDATVNQASDIYSKILNMIAAPEMMKTQRAMAQEQLKQAQLANQYYPQTQQADIDYKNILTKLMPDKYTIQEQNAYNNAGQLAHVNQRFNLQNSLGRFLGSDVGKSLYATDKDFAAAATNIMRGMATDNDYQIVGNKMPGSNQPPQYIPSFAKLVGLTTSGTPPQMNPAMAAQASNQAPLQNAQLGMPQSQQQAQVPQQSPLQISPAQSQAIMNSPQAAQLGAMVGSTANLQANPIKPLNEHLNQSADTINNTLNNSGLPSEQISEIQNRLKDILEKKSNTSAILNQRQYANVFNDIFDKNKDVLPSVYKYTGVQGQLALKRDKILAAAGISTSPDLSKYNTFETVTKPLLAAELRRKLGGQATDREIADMLNIIDPSTQWFSNPEIAKSRMEGLKSGSQSADQALAQGPEAAKSTLQGNPPPSLSQSIAQQSGLQKPQIEEKTVNGRTMRRLPGKAWIYVD